LSVRPTPVGSSPSAGDVRPFGLRHTVPAPRPAVPAFRFCERRQVAVTDDDRDIPLLIAIGNKDWKTKAKSDGDEGEEEDYGWEEER
jgi:putative ATP-grasp target RiPP